MASRRSGLLTGEVHLLAFREHLVAADTPGTRRMVVLPSCLWGSREERGGQSWGCCPQGRSDLNIS